MKHWSLMKNYALQKYSSMKSTKFIHMHCEVRFPSCLMHFISSVIRVHTHIYTINPLCKSQDQIQTNRTHFWRNLRQYNKTSGVKNKTNRTLTQSRHSHTTKIQWVSSFCLTGHYCLFGGRAEQLPLSVNAVAWTLAATPLEGEKNHNQINVFVVNVEH